MSSPQTNSGVHTRFVALKMCLNVIEHGRSLSQVLPEGLAQFEDRRERAFVQNLVLGTLRWQFRLMAIRDLLLKKKLKAKDEDVNQLILIGLFQLLYSETANHAAVSETVNVSAKLKKPWAKGLVNGLLRNFMREQESICAAVDLKPAQKYAHPQWFFKAMREAYPDNWQSVLEANNQIAPLTLRNNALQQTRAQLLDILTRAEVAASAHPHCSQGIVLTQSCDISQLPTYHEGGFSVQDAAAQQAAFLLQPRAGERILDACAAPGGKTSHLLESAQGDLDLLALEKEPERLDRLAENLHRLNLQCDYRVGDAGQPQAWWDGRQFDKILLDAPCSATGIIRRHPDIKWHRIPEDIDELVEIQQHILDALWPTLKPGGQMLYATCSVLPQENSEQMRAFLARTADAKLLPLNVTWGWPGSQIGRQILPGQDGMDGFYYCLLHKQNS
ncbi:ribosomal RNA small subunit methyltransferase B [Thiosulfatimonas sediminis]|uniref:16S rRNA (cytosine(967)-C(5))-methyltransferase n=1 Tax=Thiosulfatimonas sediminis TaxID=2675054 RepID=A0A6F8PS16_9GAMM|nr:16S rRNA (cytosine(967)-C(5))-methyltransferase RsmB [Thiosulfatimonas sediminis]BBP44876.1 ribosomal RNA small subunit methyltransferase B [Thiosulfatimonas sediminis]